MGLFSGCLTTLTDLRSYSSGQTGCPPDDITISDRREDVVKKRNTWVAICNETRYRCSRFDRNVSCTAEVLPRTTANETRTAEVVGAFALASDAVLACFPGTPRVVLALTIAPDGSVSNVRAPRPLSGDESRCVRRAFSGLRAPPAQAAALVHVWFPSDAVVIAGTAASAGTAAPTDDAAPLRIWLDGQRDGILACTQSTNVVVVARWDAGGAVTVALVGDLAGTPAEGCVRSAVGAQHLAASAAGEMRHLVR